jgi:hypothetical protein
MDRQAVARAERRRQAVEALESERARADALQEQLRTIVAELEGAAIDEAIFSSMAPEDVAVVRPALYGVEPELEDTWADLDWHSPEDAEEDAEGADQEAEISRLEEEIAGSIRRQQAFERYLDALGEI